MEGAPNLRYKHLYVVVRLDDVDELQTTSVLNRISLVATFSKEESADKEARRLNELNGDKGCVYSVYLTRLKE